MKLTLSAREQRTILAGSALAVLVFWLYTAYLIGPVMRESARLSEQVRSAQDELRLLQAATANEAALREQHEKVNQTVTSLRSLLPSEEELPTVIEHLSNLASQSQVKILGIIPQQDTSQELARPSKDNEAQPSVYKSELILIDALAGYHQLGTLLSLIEAENKPIELASLQVSSDPKEPRRHHVKLSIRSYFATALEQQAQATPPQTANAQ